MIDLILKRNNIDAFIAPSHDEFMSEYVSDSYNRLKYLTNFTGSNGAAILGAKNFFLTDGRYTAQAKRELDESFKILDLNEASWHIVFDYYCGKKIAFSPMLHSKNKISAWEKIANYTLHPVDDLFKEVDASLPKLELVKAYEVDVKYCGQLRADKIKAITQNLKADYLLITDPTSICWLLNIRGGDVNYNPVVLSYLLLDRNGEFFIICDPQKVAHLFTQKNIISWNERAQFFKNLASSQKSVQCDFANMPYWFNTVFKPHLLIDAQDPCSIIKAIKNPIELQGFRDCHQEDGKALRKFIQWLKDNIENEIDECTAAKKLLELRRQSKNFLCESFATISAYGENGAIIHYNPQPTSAKIIKQDNLYLLDSGGHYKNGTTDITRTFCFGTPTAEQKKAYTLVLKGHIALATLRFPNCTTGSQIDAIARSSLWNNGMDYAHGTGHGVGHNLSVHEGPHRISKAYSNTPLQPGMIVSNEPGFYKEGEFGIRIESLLEVVNSKYTGFLEFSILTKVAIETNLIDEKILTQDELTWIKNYNQSCII